MATPISFPIFLSLSLTALFLTGCIPIVDQDQPIVAPEISIPLSPNDTVGQTFVAQHGGLTGIEFWLAAEPGTRGQLKLHLRAEPQSSEDLAVALTPVEVISAPGFYRFTLPADTYSHGAYRYAYLTLEGEGVVWVGAASHETYINGSAYQNHKPIDAQLAFRLAYSPPKLLLELASTAINWIGLMALAFLLYVVPGYGLLCFIFPRYSNCSNQHTAYSFWEIAWPARFAIAIGISLALYPLLLLWSHALGIQLSWFYIWGPAALGLLSFAWHYRHRGFEQIQHTLVSWIRSPAFWPDVTFMALLIFVLIGRLLVIRTLDAPLWGDSYQHAVMSQLILDHGGLFETWEPYAPYRGLTVHFGFSAVTAVLAGSLGISATHATLLAGQLLNASSVLALYPLAVRLASNNRWAGVGAVLVAGSLSPMPAYYVNWGRFAQMSGQAILPVAIWWLWEAIEKQSVRRALILAALTLSGMTLHYYRMPLYYVTFLLAWIVGWAAPTIRLNAQQWVYLAKGLSITALGSLFFLMPLVQRLTGGILAAKVEAGVFSESARSVDKIIADYRIWLDIAHYVPIPLLLISLLALLLSLIQKRWVVASYALWVAGLSSLVAARLIRLPGANLMQNFAVLIALYIPVSILVGWLLGEIVQTINRFSARLSQKITGQLAVALIHLVIGISGLYEQIRIVDQRYILVTRPDIHAMEWIRKHTPSNARFLVESFRIYDGHSAVGADAGWWIPLLAYRENTMPPQYALLNETPIHPNYSEQIVELVAHLEKHSPSSPEGLRRLCDLGISHIYIGQRQGKVGAGAVQLFAPKDFINSSAFETLYHQDRVWVFALRSMVCELTQR